GDCPDEVDLVTAALEDVAASLRPVEEPRPAAGRADAAAEQERDLLAFERAAEVVDHLRRVPLVADCTDRAVSLRSGDDRPRVFGGSRHRLLEVDVHPALERRDRRLAARAGGPAPRAPRESGAGGPGVP